MLYLSRLKYYFFYNTYNYIEIVNKTRNTIETIPQQKSRLKRNGSLCTTLTTMMKHNLLNISSLAETSTNA
ncbi:hypothetical protein GCM10011514_37560 [Emticicia aquatilis]|uniref:Uncharacterized protein n=1 Tax=Emticicia aquatilis TaxID=1537369 RepID=A0A917DV11_9BACT|nr:hypothetical protein GCM10011514_37560 [Emticicia aquatilis]